MQNNSTAEETLWDPMTIFSNSKNHKYAILILDQPILLDDNFMLPFWKRAEIRITVDGGTNRWIEYLGPLSDKVYSGTSPEYTPDMVTGDLDSILPEIRTKLQQIGVKIVETMDQNHTDFTKALMQLSTECKSKNIKLNAVYVLVETTGRFDHIMANINTLYKSEKLIENVKTIICISSNSLIWLLPPGKHRIRIPEILRKKQSWVGLIPFGCSQSRISTTGLKYNLGDNITTFFGGLISTSNTYADSAEVTVTTDTKIIWSMGIEPYAQLRISFK